jgi:hypothetical protein
VLKTHATSHEACFELIFKPTLRNDIWSAQCAAQVSVLPEVSLFFIIYGGNLFIIVNLG